MTDQPKPIIKLIGSKSDTEKGWQEGWTDPGYAGTGNDAWNLDREQFHHVLKQVRRQNERARKAEALRNYLIVRGPANDLNGVHFHELMKQLKGEA